jgi:hypothetical protein
MRIGAGVAVIIALSVCGCGLLHSPDLVPTGDPQVPAAASHVPDQSESFEASPTDESDSTPPKQTSQRPEGDKPKRTANNDPQSVQLLSPKWAKEAAPQKEEWEKRLDQTVNNVCRGC